MINDQLAGQYRDLQRHLFLATIGAQSVLAENMRVGPVVFYFTLIVVGVHGAVTLGVGRRLRLDLPSLALASQANVGGPASGMALAVAPLMRGTLGG